MFFSRTLLSFAATVRQVNPATRPSLRLRKAALTLTPSAIDRLKELNQLANNPDQVLKIGLRTKGCSGSAYALDFTTIKGRFDEEVVQDGVKVYIDSKALLSIIGSEMDYIEDKLSSQFVFYNPNIKEACGCGQSFMI
ncbi:hypothetical protein CONCODRAFT_55062 [Conidiobolus coronatus NRRL 28638]|uniref:Iron-sulfur assembly protein 1 n=1 Tax=Conidiobolus coronatus (strain ATCC 28846 / CBS 209.66 / NRRL 28638) TaxID=796925 RepID=A0A137PG65_CONC2|nr:hypothetical protein CONCODRAFT_55062 [Conidiobolus coronatus NRRL 28638]|eukprot:KXN73996.1 hypothetical protein CONCODRAFT_55062 [Conidiobolus coronatus NRRL 28638]